MEVLLDHYVEAVSILLFVIGFNLLLFDKNLIKKIMGLNIMDTGVYLFLASMGYIEGRLAPVFNGVSTNPADYVNPIPAGLVLTGIVVSVSVTAISLALTVRLYKKYHTLNLDEVYRIIREEEKKEEKEERK